LAGGQDSIIEARKPSSTPDQSSEAMLLGHAHNVCAIDVSQDGSWLVSGGWDSQARVWRVGKWETEGVLEGHEGSVWAVIAWSEDKVITACADKLIRIFHPSGKLLKTIKGHTEPVRALCRLPPNHPSGAQFASAGNDSIIKLWTIEGVQVAELYGHESFIYSLTSLPTGEIVSSGEDRTVRVWRDGQCVQTITHPAISVWCVAASPNGDFVTGASDKTVRVFSRASDRFAGAEVQKAFEDSVAASSVPKQQAADGVDTQNLPGPDFLTSKSGTKEGQTAMIKEANGSIGIYQWSLSASEWVSVGTMVDSVGSSGKKVAYGGKEWDYVFDVDIAEGAPPLKLPYNLSQNPYEVAKKFVAENELPVTYLDQVAGFIISNTEGATIGQQAPQEQQQAPGYDAWGSESRYRPGDGNANALPKLLPHKNYLFIKQSNLKPITKKIEDLNNTLITSSKDLALNPTDMSVLKGLIATLDRAVLATADKTAQENGIDIVIKIIATWPAASKMPGLDLLRLIAAAGPVAATYRGSNGENIIELLESTGAFSADSPTNNFMLTIRTLVNLFATKEGLELVGPDLEKVC
jgi:phospholipase A-2-activating protein